MHCKPLWSSIAPAKTHATAVATALLLKKYRSSKKQINKTPHHTAYFVYKNTTGLSQSKKGVDWYLDHNQTIENLFFPLHFNCGSFVIIKPNGAYYSYKSEYSNNLLFRVLSSF